MIGFYWTLFVTLTFFVMSKAIGTGGLGLPSFLRPVINDPSYSFNMFANPRPDCLQACTGGQICVENHCVCPSGQLLNGGFCSQKFIPVAQSLPGQSCNSGEECTGGSICVDGICQCPPDLVHSDRVCVLQYGLVLPRQNIFSPNHIFQLPFLPPSFLPVANPKLPWPAPNCNDRCDGGQICQQNICVCPVGLAYNDGLCRPKTLPIIQSSPGEPCIAGVECTGGSVCADGICSCPNVLVQVGESCILSPPQSALHQILPHPMLPVPLFTRPYLTVGMRVPERR